jgi:hypothetical protein
MDPRLEAELEAEGWIVECESPLEIRQQDDPASFASGYAAEYIIESVRKRLKRKLKKEQAKPVDPNDESKWEYGKFGWL